MGVASSRSPAMAYADGELWCSTFDDAGNRCWVHSQTGETVYYFVGGKPARRPSNTTTSPYTAQDANQSQPWGSPGPVMLSPGHVHRNPGPVMLSPGHVHRSPGHVHRSPGHAHHNPGPLPPSPGPVHHNPGPVHYNPGPVPGPVHHSPAPVHHSPGPATLAAGYGAPNYPGTTMVPYHQQQPGYGEGVAPAGNPAPTPAGEAVGYSSNKSYIRPRSKSWMWTP